MTPGAWWSGAWNRIKRQVFFRFAPDMSFQAGYEDAKYCADQHILQTEIRVKVAK